jgi:hypothetical protein
MLDEQGQPEQLALLVIVASESLQDGAEGTSIFFHFPS